jgi:hypothetical protein
MDWYVINESCPEYELTPVGPKADDLSPRYVRILIEIIEEWLES